MATQLVLRNRDLILSVAMQCVHPSQLATLSALCKMFEELVFTQRQLWHRQLALLWPLPSARATRDPRSFCRRLLESNRRTPELTSLDSVVMLLVLRKFGVEHSFEFNLGSLTYRHESVFGDAPETVAWLPMPSLSPTDAAHIADVTAAYIDAKNGWFVSEKERFPWMSDAKSFKVVLLRTDVLKVSRGKKMYGAGGRELWRDGVLLVPGLQTQAEFEFGTECTSDVWRLGEYVPQRDLSLNRRLDFIVWDGGWVMRLREETRSKRGDVEWDEDGDDQEENDARLPLSLLLDALNIFRWT